MPRSAPRWLTHPKTITHPVTNRPWRRVTTLIETNVLPLSQTGNQRYTHFVFCPQIILSRRRPSLFNSQKCPMQQRWPYRNTAPVLVSLIPERANKFRQKLQYCSNHGDHLSGKPGNVRDFDSCQGNVRDFTNNQGNVILSGKSCLKLFIVSCIFASIQVFSRSLFCVKY